MVNSYSKGSRAIALRWSQHKDYIWILDGHGIRAVSMGTPRNLSDFMESRKIAKNRHENDTFQISCHIGYDTSNGNIHEIIFTCQ